jgi:hypothetical protein
MFLFFANSYAQNHITFTGHVLDENGKPLPSANLMSFKKGESKMESFGITDLNGRFKLRLNAHETYLVKTSFIGYISDSLIINTTTQPIQKDLILKEQNATLGEVELVENIPIMVKGDSIVYHADDFTNGTEKKLGDILENLPGVEVNEDGEVEVEGKTVQTVLVEGKKFFDGDSKIAVENIPSDAVSKIEVLKNFSDIKQLQNVRNNQDNIALNIKLKEGKKNFWFGDISAGIGYENRYIVNPKLFYYSPKLSVNVLTNFNNNGDIPFTRRDFFRFTGGIQGRNQGTSLALSSDNLGFSSMKNNRAEEIGTQFGALNLDYEFNEKLRLNTFFVYSGNQTDMREAKTSLFLKDQELERSNRITHQENTLALGKVSLVYKKDENLQINYTLFGKISDEQETVDIHSQSSKIENNIQEYRNADPASVNQSLNIYKTLDNQDIISIDIKHLWSKENPFYEAEFNNLESNASLPFSTLFPYQNFDINMPIGIGQNKKINTNKLDGLIDYYWVFNKKQNISFTLGNTYSNQNFNSGIFQFQEQTKIGFSDDKFNNDILFSFNDLFAGVNYRHLIGKWLINPSFTYHQYHIKDEQKGQLNSKNKGFLSPKLMLEYRFKENENIRFNYNRTAHFADVYSYINSYVLNNYRSIYQGNNGIQNGIYDTYSLAYSSFSFYNGTSVNAQLSYNRNQDAIKNNFVYEGINAISSIINSSVEDESWTLRGKVDQSIGKIKLNFNTRIGLKNNFNTLENKIVESNSFTQLYKASLRTNFDKGPNFEIGYQHNYDQFDNHRNTQNYTTNRPFLEVEWRIKDSWTFQADYSFYRYAQEGEALNTYDFLNSRISYEKNEDSQWEWSLGMTNLLNTQQINANSFSDQISSTTNYYVQPRMLIFKVNYAL